MGQRNRIEGSQEKAVATAQAPHKARLAALEVEVLARLAADNGPRVSDDERADGLLFDSG
jgi:hypothetical protein